MLKWSTHLTALHLPSSQLRISVFISSSLALSSEYMFYKVRLITPGTYVCLLGVGGNVKRFAGETMWGGCSWGWFNVLQLSFRDKEMLRCITKGIASTNRHKNLNSISKECYNQKHAKSILECQFLTCIVQMFLLATVPDVIITY